MSLQHSRVFDVYFPGTGHAAYIPWYRSCDMFPLIHGMCGASPGTGLACIFCGSGHLTCFRLNRACFIFLMVQRMLHILHGKVHMTCFPLYKACTVHALVHVMIQSTAHLTCFPLYSACVLYCLVEGMLHIFHSIGV